MYLLIKHSHLTLVLLSVSFLIIRVIAAAAHAQWLQKKWAKIAPHIIDTFLLLTAIILMVMINQFPIINHWLTTKMICLIAYIAFGVFALKGEKGLLSRLFFLFLALACIALMASAAITKQALPFF